MVSGGGSAVCEHHIVWRERSLTGTLMPGQIHLWLIPLDQLPTHYIDGFSADLTDREFQRASRIVDVEKRKLYCGGRIGLRLLLQGYSEIDRDGQTFEYGDRGKPRLKQKIEGKRLEFNYTVSSNYALYAFCWDAELGVDLEIFPRAVEYDLFSKRILTSAEAKLWQQVPENQRNQTMLACWTRKEAYGKLLGVGIRYRMNEVELFASHREHFETTISGLFDDQKHEEPKTVEGVQVKLPVAGAASLMRYQTGNFDPELLGFVFKNTS